MERIHLEQSYYDDCGVTPIGVAIIERVRRGLPVRNTNSGNQSCAGAFMSQKMGMSISVESRTLEMAYAKTLDFDDEVREFYDQPHQLHLKTRRADGRNCAFTHVPDFLVIHDDGVWFVELKPWNKLVQKAESQPARFILNGDERWVSPPAEAALEGTGIGYRIVSDRDISPVLIRNITHLADFRTFARGAA